MTEQEQKAFDQMRQALKDIAEESFDKGAVECANHALTAANAVSEQQWEPVEEMSEQIAELSLVIATNSFYQQGHKDGLEWAAQMVEYNDPRTGDWMWDDRNDLANVIRKGPELPDAVSHPQATEPQAQAVAWDEGYAAGVNDERISECNIGIAGFDAKVNPARENPYRRAHPRASEPTGWKLVPVEPTDEMMRAMTDPFMAVNGDNRKAFFWAYPRMLAAAPEAHHE